MEESSATMFVLLPRCTEADYGVRKVPIAHDWSGKERENTCLTTPHRKKESKRLHDKMWVRFSDPGTVRRVTGISV